MTDMSSAKSILMEMLDEVDVESTTLKKLRKMLEKRMGVKFSKEEKKSMKQLIHNTVFEIASSQKSSASDKENEKTESQASQDENTPESEEAAVVTKEIDIEEEIVMKESESSPQDDENDELNEEEHKESSENEDKEEEKYDDTTKKLSSNFLSRYKEDSEDEDKEEEKYDDTTRKLSSNFLSRYKEDSDEEEEEREPRKKTRRNRRKKKELESDEEDDMEADSGEDNYVDEDDFIVKDDDEDWNPDEDGDYTEDEDDDGKKKKKKGKRKRKKKEEKIAGKRTGKRIQVSSKSASTMHDPIAILADMSDEEEEKENDDEDEDAKDSGVDEDFVDEEDQLAALYMEERQREDQEALGIRGVAHQRERERFRQRGTEKNDEMDVEMKSHETRGSEKRKRDEARKAKMAEQCSEKLDTFLEKLKARKKRKHDSSELYEEETGIAVVTEKSKKKRKKKKKSQSLLVILPQVPVSKEEEEKKKKTSITNEITATPSVPLFSKEEPSQSLYGDNDAETQAMTQTQDVEMTQPLFQYTQSEMVQDDDDDEMMTQSDEIPPTQIVSDTQENVSPTQIVVEETPSSSNDSVDSSKPVSLFEQVMQKRNNNSSVRQYGKKREIVKEKVEVDVEKEVEMEEKQISGLEPSTGSNFAFAQQDTQQQEHPKDDDEVSEKHDDEVVERHQDKVVEKETNLKLLDDEAEDEEEEVKTQETHDLDTQQEEGDLSFVVNNQEEEEEETSGGASKIHVAMMMNNMGSTQEIEEDLESQNNEETDISLAQDTQGGEEATEIVVDENELARQQQQEQLEMDERKARKQEIMDQEEEEAQQAQWFKERARLQRKLRELQPQTSVLGSFMDDDEESQQILGLLERNTQSRMSIRDDESSTPPLNVVRSGSRRKGFSAKMSRTFSFRRALSDGNASNSSSAFNAQHSNSGIVAAATTASRSFIFVQQDTSKKQNMENEKEISGIRKRPSSAISSGFRSKRRRHQKKTRSLFSTLSINRFSKKPLRSKSS